MNTFDISPPGSAGRVAVGWCSAGQKGGLMIITAYFWTREGWTIRNLSILEAIATVIKQYDIPWIFQVDFNETGESLIKTGWCQDVGGVARLPNTTT
eukprot:8317574-Pyramimonas_sp.AAC.1